MLCGDRYRGSNWTESVVLLSFFSLVGSVFLFRNDYSIFFLIICMASQVFFTLKSCFSFVDDRFLSEFLYGTMFSYGNSLWMSLCKFILSVFWFIAKYIRRGMADHKPQENGSSFMMPDHKPQENGSSFIISHSQEDDLVVSKTSMDFLSDVATEEEGSNFSFSLLGQDFKDSTGNSAETEDSAFPKTDFSPNVLKYQFVAANNVMGFMEEPRTSSFTIQEMFVGSNDSVTINSHAQNIDGGVSQYEDLKERYRHSNASSNDDAVSRRSRFCISDTNIEESNIEEGTSEQEIEDFSVKNPHAEAILEEKEASVSPQNKILIHEEMDGDISYEVQLLPRNEFTNSDFYPESESSSDGMIEVPCSTITDDPKPEDIERSETREQVMEGNSCTIRKASVNEETEEDVDDEYIELKPRSSDVNEVIQESSSQKDNFLEDACNGGKETELMDEATQGFGEERFVKGSLDSDSDEEDEFDILLEHQQLVKQMKMERKNSKLKGLPTISEEEECETPKILEDLKPLKIDDKFEYKDLMEEIQKFYKSYAEKMRKLDILNYQTLHAISFLQLKDSQLFMPSKKSLISSIKPFTLPSFSLFKQQRIHADPTLKSINKMHRDLELVYVGQVCLSWEILLWQYGKVKEFQEHDSRGSHSYNQVAGECQQFQVLLQRFLEDERFQGPRIQHYVKSRCFFRGLLQVPCIKDDCPKNKKELIGEEVDAISITMLAENIKDSMQIFWEFIHADKEEASGVLKSGFLGDIQSPADSQLLVNVRTCLEKKERKIKDILRSRNCVVKKFQKHQPSPSTTALLISQVELRLVARVLNMSRLTTDHLIWCLKKLNNISIVNRKVGVETAFLLFPC